MGLSSRPRRVLLAATIFTFCFYLSLDRWSQFLWRAAEPSPAPVVCPQSPLLDDILVVLRTGATEAREKLPVHFQTVLTCVPDLVIYSDFEEDVAGHHLHDVLDEVDEEIRKSNPDFGLYNKLRAHGRDGLDYQTLFGSGGGGATDNPGWKLDKWKFLPMVDRALRHRPQAKWFVFVEGDTYLVWQNMLAWLARFDPEKPHYLGKHMYIGDVLFGHGGSGFVLSNPTMQMVSQRWRERKAEIEAYTAESWAGDMVLGKVIKDVGIDMVWSFPNLQGDSPTTMDWNVSKLGREPWCYAPTTFHHLNRLEYEALWRFERRWLVGHPTASAGPRFGDVFKGVILPRLRQRRDSWDNMAEGIEHSAEAFGRLPEEERGNLTYAERQAPGSFEGCRTLCECKRDCIQFSFSSPGRCVTSAELRLGHAADSPCMEYSNAAARCLKPVEPGSGSLGSSSEQFI
ncbi:hypothetical protein PG996_003018 [Apiospora saccharicola]|uniref:N-acetylgalactosaminide beta-1,3-galactosyltransferase n=1 Tax=Apiospora saccharicola TaxID=335842 RepID=A0ABR1W3X2_9PEZI